MSDELADLVKRLRDGPMDARMVRVEAPAAIEALLRQSATVRALALEEVCAAISEQISTQRVIVRAIKNREEKHTEAARLVGMGDAVLIAKSLASAHDLEALAEKLSRGFLPKLWEKIDRYKDDDDWNGGTSLNARNAAMTEARAVLAAVGFK